VTANTSSRWRVRKWFAAATITENHPLSPADRQTDRQIGRMRQDVNVWFHLVLRLQASATLHKKTVSTVELRDIGVQKVRFDLTQYRIK